MGGVYCTAFKYGGLLYEWYAVASARPCHVRLAHAPRACQRHIHVSSRAERRTRQGEPVCACAPRKWRIRCSECGLQPSTGVEHIGPSWRWIRDLRRVGELAGDGRSVPRTLCCAVPLHCMQAAANATYHIPTPWLEDREADRIPIHVRSIDPEASARQGSSTAALLPTPVNARSSALAARISGFSGV